MGSTVCALQCSGWRVLLVHGNGPQVGNLAIQQDEGAHRVPRMPMFVLDAMTEGQLGSVLTLALHEAAGGRLSGVVSVITHVVVDEADSAFERPTKPVGPFMGEDEARRRSAELGWTVTEDSGRGYRRAHPRDDRAVRRGSGGPDDRRSRGRSSSWTRSRRSWTSGWS